MSKITIGTRGSILALAQAEKVKEMLIEKYKKIRENVESDGSGKSKKILEMFGNSANIEVEIKVIVTKGDKDMRDFQKIQEISQKDLFVKEIEREMLNEKIDLAVHSLKDMPQNTPIGLINASFPIREDNRDVLVSRKGEKLSELPKNAIVGTGSIRREKEILNNRKDVEIKGIRGNIHTRLKKLENGEYNAIVLAVAGLKRVGLMEKITQYFDESEIMPAPGQGILCVQCRENDEKIRALLNELNDPDVQAMCNAEREFSKIFDGGCHTPIGCSSKIIGDEIILKGMYYNENEKIFAEIRGKKDESEELARRLADKIKMKI